ncbi:MAG: peptidylprolyl isomerase, partial [Bacteroidales bacterium]|nr:peptidylprolyl isomerase [Bacteroidales bacterium]
MAALGWLGAATAMQAACLTPDTTRHEVVLETTEGNISVVLYNETPQHRDNFLRLVREGFYDGLLFHRVIPQFM